MISEKAADTILLESDAECYPRIVRALEEQAIQARRSAAWVTPNNEFVPANQRGNIGPAPNASQGVATASAAGPVKNLVGLALSGGGVRSSTFSLGVLQALAGKSRLRHIDFLSTVSGGGFTGGFLGRLFTRKIVASVPDPVGRIEEILVENQSSVIRWLRTQANYLFASGTDDRLLALGIFFRNVFTVHLVIGALLLALFGSIAGISRLPIYQKLSPPTPWPLSLLGPDLSPWWWMPIAVLLLMVAPITLGFWLAPKAMSYRSHPSHALAAWLILLVGTSAALAIPGKWRWAGALLVVLVLAWLWQEFARLDLDEDKVKERRLEGDIMRNRLSRGLGVALVFLVLALGWVVLDSAAGAVAAGKGHLSKMIAALVALAPVLPILRRWALNALLKDYRPSAQALLKITGVVLALALLFLVDAIAHRLFWILSPGWAWSSILFALLLSLALGRAFDFLNLSSLHSSYGARIIRTFLGASNEARTQSADNVAADVQIAHPEDDLPHHCYRPEQDRLPAALDFNMRERDNRPRLPARNTRTEGSADGRRFLRRQCGQALLRDVDAAA